jgi:UDP-glucose 4-epimerase
MTRHPLGPVLVTGGCGYVGAQFVWLLHDRGIPVVVVDDLSTGFAAALPEGVPLIVQPVQDVSPLRAAVTTHGVRAMVHFAASVSLAESVVKPLAYWRNNLGGTLAVLEACMGTSVERVLLSSTAAAYGMPEGDGPVAEDAPARPASPYGSSKLAAEVALMEAAAAHGHAAAALRYFNVAGADPAGRTGSRHADPTHLIGAALSVCLGRRPALDIFGADWPTPDGTAVRDFVHVADVAAAHLRVLESLRPGDRLTLNVGYGKGHSVAEVVAAVRHVTGHALPVRMAPRRPGDVASVVADATRLHGLGWQPRHARLDRMVEDAWAWAQKTG